VPSSALDAIDSGAAIGGLGSGVSFSSVTEPRRWV
jgi:hypothetical protein